MIHRRCCSSWRRARPALLPLGLLAVAAAGCRPEVVAPEIPPPPVVVATAESRDVTVWREFTGNTVGFETVEIRARVSGTLEGVEFRPSTMVRAGQRLFVIEPEPYEAARDRAAANLASAEAALRRAESDLERLEQAVRTNAVSQQEVTRARAERDQASAAMAGSKAALRDAEIQLGYTGVTSPITGIIGRNLVDQGNLVGPGGDSLLARVIRIDPIYAYFAVDERTIASALQDLGGIDEDRRTTVEPPRGIELYIEGRETPFEGSVDYIDNRVDPETGTIQVRGVFPNPERVLLPGFFVRVRIPVEDLAGALVVPETALSTDLGGRFLLLVDDGGVVAKRYVETGPPGAGRDAGDPRRPRPRRAFRLPRHPEGPSRPAGDADDRRAVRRGLRRAAGLVGRCSAGSSSTARSSRR